MAGIDSFVVFGSHLDGTDGATAATDFSTAQAAKTITFNGNAQLDTGRTPKFGTAALLTDGSGDSITCADSADWDFGTGDFTIDFWWNPISQAINQALFDVGGGYSLTGVQFYQSDSGSLQVYVHGVSVFGTLAPSFSNGTWYHLELARSGTDLRLFKDGTQLGSTATNSTDITGSVGGLIIGAGAGGLITLDSNGSFDEPRISKGIARHTTNFTPETEAYSGSGGAVSTRMMMMGCC